MKLAALDGKDSMQHMVHEFSQFAESVRVASQEVEGLGEHSEKIGEVVFLIKDIADQTNLLALNAAIEAARAGDSGRGFAVVADNVRALSQRTTQATEEINQMVKEMQSRVVHSVSSMKQERHTLETVVTRVDYALSKIDEIVVFVEQVTDMVDKIAVASEEQSATSEEINQNMANIEVVNSALAGSSLHIKDSAGELSLLAQNLKEMVGVFKV
jgi:methyl-accepting chemotaxis protein